jgi:ribosomal protein S6--L-glutamate ligase
MKTILVVNGENFWSDFFPESKVVRKSIQDSTWMIKDGQLIVFDAESVVSPDAILWRVGAIRPDPLQMHALNLINLSGIPCVNSAESLKVGHDRLSMLAALQKCRLPMLPFNVVTRSSKVQNIALPYPFVVKAGNYHGGYGKVLVTDDPKWQDTKDLLFVANDYVTIEPFVDYVRDIRYLAIREQVWAMSRKGKYWKANVGTVDFQQFEPEPNETRMVKELQESIGADIVAIDILEDQSGEMFVIEYNDIPGLSGFSEGLKYALAEVVKGKLG